VVELRSQDMDPIVKRLRRAQGQIGGVLRMIEEGRDCEDRREPSCPSRSASPPNHSSRGPAPSALAIGARRPVATVRRR